MCLIVVKNKAEASFSVDDFKSSIVRNNDGTGIAYVENGRVVVEKSMGTPQEQLALYYKHMNKPQFLLHHRFATQGEKTELNCHPFKVLSLDDGDPYDLYFAHNGGIQMRLFSTDHDKKLSDTHLFALEYLAPILKKAPDLLDCKPFQNMLHDLLGTYNKLAFIRNDNRMWIFNKSQGDEHNGCWLSNKNTIYEKKATTITYAREHGVKNDYTDYESDDWWRKNYNHANTMKNKAAHTESGMSPDDILRAITDYQGMPILSLEDLFITEPHMVYDMINMLSRGDVVAKTLLDEPTEKVAEQLWNLLQDYSKLLIKAA